MFDDKRKIIDGQLYWHYSLLKNWDKNNQARMITEENWDKLVGSIQRSGIKDPFKIGMDGIVYDGNNRFKGVNKLIRQGIIKAANGKDLEWIPVDVRSPKTESEKWDIALTGNEQFAQWSQEGLANFMPEFEQDLDLSLINISFSDPLSLPESLEPKDENGKQNNQSDKEEVECPNCKTKFIPS